jgi:hypothetical protein
MCGANEMPVGKEETIAVKAFQYSKTISGLVVHLDVIPRLEYFLECFSRTDLNENGRWQFQVPRPPPRFATIEHTGVEIPVTIVIDDRISF